MKRSEKVAGVLRMLREDGAWTVTYGLRFLVLNNIAGSVLVPRAARMALYRLMGLDVRTPDIASGATIIGRAPLRIGPGTYVNRRAYIELVAPVTLGESVGLGIDVMLVTSDHPILEDGTFMRSAMGRSILIGDRCWISSRAVVLPGVTIGDDVIVAAGAVVTRDCAPRGVYAGVPARRIKEREIASETPEGGRTVLAGS
ncbi:acyltransferase [Actinomycetospora lemnae]|uniref:Acyltransferase n=1 Tax=Actinomycetospora lemnae TaxID=3019891 RepID=A0ABT5SVE0_9PSEU|nr:acyltransferase [Actinomycetospora sp. DW7H6]MDD7966791.1 acyltransferase [Actinomycetospora sp. DW7H6]